MLGFLRTLLALPAASAAKASINVSVFAVVLPVATLIGIVTLLLDALASPVVLALRKRRPSTAPARRDASIVTVSWNGKGFLERLLPSLDEAIRVDGGDHEVIVVDNGSDDDTVPFLREHYPSVRVVSLPENRFFVRGNLAGVAAATRDVLVFLNNDMVVQPDFLRGLLEGFDHPDVFAVSSEIFFLDPEKRREETGKTRGYFDDGFVALGHAQPADCDRRLGYTPVFWAGGGSTAVDRAKFLEIGGFDLLYDPFYLEDAGLSYQAWKRGWRVLFTPRSRVYHEHRGTSRKLFGDSYVENVVRRNKYLFLWRNVSDPVLTARHFLRLPYNLLRFATAAPRGHAEAVAFELRAFLRALARLPAALVKRQLSRPAYRRSDRDVLRVANSTHRYLQAIGAGRRVRDTGSGLRILVLCARLPRLNTDGSWVLFNLLRELARRHRITLFSFIDTPEEDREADSLRAFCARVETFVRGTNQEMWNLHHRDPHRLARDYSAPRMRDAVRETLGSTDFDVVQVEYAEMAHVVRDEIRDLPSVYTVHEPLCLFQRRLLDSARGLAKVPAAFRWAQYLDSELRAMARFRHLVTLSFVDEQVLRAYLPAPPISSIPSGIDVERFQPAADQEVEPIVTFVGFFRHHPNIDGALWLAKRVFPAVRERVPGARLRLVGKDPPPRIRELESVPGVEVTGYVPDVRPYMAESAVMAVSIRLGAGLRGKLLEAWAAGKALVTTARGAEGFELEPGRHALVADDPREFADHVVACLLDPELRARLGREGRRLVEERYSAAAMARSYERVYAAVLGVGGSVAARSPARSETVVARPEVHGG